MCWSMAWSNALSSVPNTAQLGLCRHAASLTRCVKTDMLTGTWVSRRNAASASLASAAKPSLNLSWSRNPNPSSPMSITKSGVAAKPSYCCAGALAAVRHQGGDVDQAGHLVMQPGLGDDGAAPGMSDEDGGSVLQVQHPGGGGDVVLEGREADSGRS